jgi:hypothetical protein
MKFGDGCFSYATDWAGFNVPSNVIWDLYYSSDIDDLNQYDTTFHKIIDKITCGVTNNEYKYYLIGAETNAKGTIAHEVAHAFYYLYPSYKKVADKITSNVSEKNRNKIKKWLTGIGYNDKVFKDELQAYLCADIDRIIECCEVNKSESKKLQNISNQLQELNKEYANRKN